MLRQRSSHLQSWKSARMSRSCAKKVCGWDGGHPGRRVARNCNRGVRNSQVSTFEYPMPLVFQSIIHKMCYFGAFLWICVIFMPVNKKYVFIKLTSFKSMFLVKFLASSLLSFIASICLKKFPAEAHVNFSMPQVQDLQYAFSRQYCSWAKSRHCRHYDRAFYIHILLMCTTTLSSKGE